MAEQARGLGPLSGSAGALAVLFGLATVGEGGHVLFGGPEARAAAGNIVLFVLVFNFTAGFIYILAGALTLLKRKEARWVALALAVSTLLVFAAFGFHVLEGGKYEARTVGAMTLRSLFWTAQTLALWRWAKPDA